MRYAVELSNGKVYSSAFLVVSSLDKDIAVIKIPAESLSSLPLGNSEKVIVGAHIVTVSNPLGFKLSLSEGVVSAIRDEKNTKYIQITAPISPGSSGGPLLNNKGVVIGIITSQVPSIFGQNLNFAIPIEYLFEVLSNSKRIIPFTKESPQKTQSLLPKVIKRPPFSLKSGTEIKSYQKSKGYGMLTIKNGTDFDAVVKLVTYSEPRKTKRDIYIRAKDKVIMKNIEKGKYICRFCLGIDWDKKHNKFLKNKSYSQFLAPLYFQEIQKENGIEYSVYKITLNPVFGGTAKVVSIDEKTFEEE